MAYTDNEQTITLPAGGDLSAKQFYFMKTSSGQAVASGDGENAVGVLQNDPAAAGRAATIAHSGVTKVMCGGVVTVDGPVASDASGTAVDAATGDVILGTALETGASGSVIPILFQPRGTA